MKHIDVQIHFIRENLVKGDIFLRKIDTTDIPIDRLNNMVCEVKF